MLIPLKPEVRNVPDLAHQARRFRTVAWSFHRNSELLFSGTELIARIDDEALALAFARWRQAFDGVRNQVSTDRRDLVIFAAGLMLRELIRSDPMRVARRRGRAVPTDVHGLVGYWPEGYAYSSYCFSVAAAVIEEQGDAELRSAGVADDRGFWASFRENVIDDASTAVGFFDLICGQTPNWGFPWLRSGDEQRRPLLHRQ